MTEIEFYFDLRSPYTYFAWHRRKVLEDAGAKLSLVPVSIDVLLNLQAGAAPWAAYVDPLSAQKRRHLMADIPRMAHFWGIPLGGPFTFKPQAKRAMCLSMALLASGADQSDFVDVALSTLWLSAKDISDDAIFDELKARFAPKDFNEAAALTQLTEHSAQSFQQGVFGVPTFRIADKIYFGADRMDVLAAYLAVPRNAAP